MKLISMLAVLLSAGSAFGQWSPYQKKAFCICGDACACPAGDCPAKCPVTPGTFQLPPAPAGFEWRKDNTAFGWGLFQVGMPTAGVSRPAVQYQPTIQFAPRYVQSNCPNGQCPLPKR